MIGPALAVVRKRLWPIVGFWLVLPLSVVLSFGLVGIPFATRVFAQLALECRRGAYALEGYGVPEEPNESRAGSIAFAGVVAFVAAHALVLAAASHLLGDAVAIVELSVLLAIGALACVVIAAAVAPLLLAPFCAVAGARGFFAPFSRSFEIAARRGAKPTLWLGAGIGAVFAFAFVATGLAFYGLPAAAGLAAVHGAGPVSVLLVIPLVFAALARVHARHEKMVQVEPTLVRVRLRGLAWMLAPALVAFVATFVVAALTPSRMQPLAEPPELVRGFHAFEMGLSYRSGRIPGTAVRLRTTPRGIVIETEDGGGAGEVDAGLDAPPVAFYVRERVVGERRTGEFVIVITDGERWVSTTVDRDGVRLDDSIAGRAFGRLGRTGSTGLALALLLLLYLSFTLGAELGAARTLCAPALLEDGETEHGGLRALEATLRIADESTVRFSPASFIARILGNEAGRLTVEGEAWLEADGGALRFRLPDHPIGVLGVRCAHWNGEHVILLSRFDAGVTAGLRESSVEFPTDGRLALGTQDDVSEVLIAGAVRRASAIVIPVLAGLFTASASVLLAL